MSQLDLAGPEQVPEQAPEQVGDGASGPDRVPAGLRLIAPVGESTWLGRDADGRSVTARRLVDMPDAADPAADPAADQTADPTATDANGAAGRAVALASSSALSLMPVLGVQHRDGALWLVSALDDGVWLSRLLELTTPSPAQAVVIGLDVLRGLRTVHAAGFAHGSLSPAQIRVGGDGRTRLDGWAAAELTEPAQAQQRKRADVAAAGLLLAALADAVRGSPPVPAGSALALLAALDTAVGCAALPGADAEFMAAPLEHVYAANRPAVARTELAALVAAATGNLPPSRYPPPVSSAATAFTPESDPREVRVARALRLLWQRVWAWVVALAVLAGVVTLEFAFLHERLTHDLHVLQGAGRPGQDPQSQAGVRPAELPAVRAPAPASSGAVAGVDLRAVEPCTPGTVCTVRVLVRLQPQAAAPRHTGQVPPREVAWTFQVVDRCTGDQRTAAGGSVSVPPSGAQVQAVSAVPVPMGRSLAVVAVTSQPASAASRPLPVPDRQGSC
ncbi:MAG TPA: hypothetical protein VGJ13_11420 [Pseudonocardiaceae bacterium]